MAEKFIHVDTSDVETTESFFSDRFLRARIESGRPSNEGYDLILEEGRDVEWQEAHWKEIKDNQLKYDEDVNQYITLTLSDLVKPQSQALTNKYLVSMEADAGQLAVDECERSKKFVAYRVNADFFLLSLGLFRSDTNILGDAYIDKGGYYYSSAASSLKEVFGGRSALSDTMEKLSRQFGKYVEILRYMKNSDDNFLSFHFKFTKPEIETLERTLTEESDQRKKSRPN
ncbi:MAG TPA: hypothetical protein DCX78_09545 [Nitrospina sp.]|jgi:hypothetical protein|nr:hypothetical protein [Nitrospinota bacterium]MBV52351.1 hypothetical protein [Nitrospinota bacterium]MDP6335626.1 hypothetical protein [Nitrospinaceae bacterium]HAX47050.1 hypothetical protein [Nitrospina sp.]|tara:strand:- start:3929 stop:4615 length:687 start_codon:yes stop_codon:yes gene_type:complete